MSLVELEINGKKISQDVEERQLLVHFIRDDLNLTGTHVGCDTSQCGACVIHIDGKAVKSCSMLAVQANDTKIQQLKALQMVKIFILSRRLSEKIMVCNVVFVLLEWLWLPLIY